MTNFSEILMEHFQYPANRGKMEAPDLVGKASLNGYPPFMTFYLRLDEGRIICAAFEAEGCGVTIACGSMLTGLISGRTLAECAQITVDELSQALDGTPAGKEYCALVALSALQDALRSTPAN